MKYKNELDQEIVIKELKKRINYFNFSFSSIYSSYDKLKVFNLYQDLIKIEKDINEEYSKKDINHEYGKQRYNNWVDKLQEIYILFNRYIGARVVEKIGFFDKCTCNTNNTACQYYVKSCIMHGWKDKEKEVAENHKEKEYCKKKPLIECVPNFNNIRESIWSYRVDDTSNSSYGGVSF